MIADRILDALKLLCRTVDLLRTKCIDVLEADPDGCRRHLDSALIVATVVSPYIGYEKASALAKEFGGDRKSFLQAVVERGYLSKEKLDIILKKAKLEE